MAGGSSDPGQPAETPLLEPGGRVPSEWVRCPGSRCVEESAPGCLRCCLLAVSLSVPVSRQEFGSECEAWTHSLLLGDLRVEQAKIMQPP